MGCNGYTGAIFCEIFIKSDGSQKTITRQQNLPLNLIVYWLIQRECVYLTMPFVYCNVLLCLSYNSLCLLQCITIAIFADSRDSFCNKSKILFYSILTINVFHGYFTTFFMTSTKCEVLTPSLSPLKQKPVKEKNNLNKMLLYKCLKMWLLK